VFERDPDIRRNVTQRDSRARVPGTSPKSLVARFGVEREQFVFTRRLREEPPLGDV